MKRNSFFFSLLLSLNLTLVLGVDKVTPPGNFGGGLNIKNLCSEIGDDETCDSSNMVSDIYGASSKRNGSSRYVSQAISTNPVNFLARIYASTGATFGKVTVAASGSNLYYSTDNASWVIISSGFAPNQHFEYAMQNNRMIVTGDGLTDQIKSFNIFTGSMTHLLTLDTSTTTVLFRARHLLNSRNYLLAANIQDLSQGTTNYPSRVHFSLLLIPSSFTYTRYIDYQADDGEGIQYLGELNRKVHIFKETSIGELDWTAGLNLTTLGGDQTLKTVVRGFGCIAPRSAVNIGLGYIFLAKDGIRFWGGTDRTRLNVTDESRILSIKIEPIITRIIRNNTYRNSVGQYYAKRGWYVFSYEDPEKSPRGRNNSVLIYDILKDAWFPVKNWNIECFASMDGVGDNGELLYGDSTDGYVYYADGVNTPNDARRELSVHNMDKVEDWNRGTQDRDNVREGTASVKTVVPTILMYSSVSYMGVINAGEWPDKSKITKADKISFKVFASSPNNLKNISLQIEMNDVKGDFDTNFTSVTISSAALTPGNSTWTTIEVAISSFVVPSTWTDLATETLPFANTFTFYGIRFVSTGIGWCALSYDDLRIVGANESPLNAYRFTKQFNFGSSNEKSFKGVYLNTEQNADSSFYIDTYKDFGQFTKREAISGTFQKELYVAGYGGVNNVTKLNSVDFSILSSTVASSQTYFAIRPLVVDEKYIYAGDQYNHRILKVDKSSMGVIVSSFGSLGSGTTNFNGIYQMAVDENYLYVCDFFNQRVKIHNKKDLTFVKAYGQLGQNTTSFHNPTGVAVDDRNLYIGNDGNYQIMKLDKSSGGFIASTDLNLNTIGDTTLAVDEQYLFCAYNSISQTSIDFVDVVLEKRVKSSLELVNKTIIRTLNSVALSTYGIMGDISLSDDYVYVSFTDDQNANGGYYIQKRLKSDFSVIREYRGTGRHFAVSHIGLAYKPKRKTIYSETGGTGYFLQLRFSENGLDNSMKLYNQAYKLDEHEVR